MLIIAAGIFLRVYGLSDQLPLDDDVAFTFTAANYMENGQPWPSMGNQPILRNILLYASIKTFGAGPVGVWGVSLSCGILSLVLIALICRELFEQREVALLAAFFFALDPLHIAFSRQAIQEAATLFFILAAVYMTLLYVRKRQEGYLVATGIAFGAGLACKWLPALPFLFCGVWLLSKEPKLSLARIIRFFIILVILPGTLYVITYLPWFMRGYDLADWYGLQQAFLSMNIHHDNPVSSAIHNTGNPFLWFVWPVGYGSFGHVGLKPFVTIGMGNYAVWFLTIPSVLYLTFWGFKAKNGRALLIAGLFAVSYGQALLASAARDIYVLSALTVAPFAFIAIAFSLVRFSERLSQGRRVLAVYLGVVTLVTALMYPLSISRALDYDYVQPLVQHYNPH